MTNRLEYPGYNALMDGLRQTWDSHDPYGSVQEWRFALCEVLYFDLGEYVPEFNPGYATEPEDSWAVDVTRECIQEGADVADLQSVLEVLDRYRVWVGLAGRDY